VFGIAYLSLVVGELVPKGLAVRHAETWAVRVAPTIEAISRIMRPAVTFLTASSRICLRLLGRKDPGFQPFHTREDLRAIAEEAQEQGIVQGGLVTGAVEFHDRQVREVVTPPPRVVALSAHVTLEQALRIVRDGLLFRPGEPWMLHAFLGAMLAATSVGITARVLKDADALRAPFARIILGAAVIDDVLGLLVLAIVSGIITAASTRQTLGLAPILMIVFKAFAFLAGALVIGSVLSPRLFRSALALRSAGVVQALALSLCFGLAYLAVQAGLAPIVGAFAAGLVLEDVHFEDLVRRGERPLHESLEPLTQLLVPVFFVRMGMLVDIRSFTSRSVILFAIALTLAAILGKLACAFAAPKGISGLTIGLGMMPRGEVGLIFAGIGAQLILGGRPVVETGTYAAAVFMVVATTMATPPLLLWSLRLDRGYQR
jgi:Kef-type K+ transport system membrane component KefB